MNACKTIHAVEISVASIPMDLTNVKAFSLAQEAIHRMTKELSALVYISI